MSLKYPLVHIDDVRPGNMEEGDGWAISEFRLPISSGSNTKADGWPETARSA